MVGLLYLAMVLDVFSRRITGWMMTGSLRTELVLAALEMAVHTATPARSRWTPRLNPLLSTTAAASTPVMRLANVSSTPTSPHRWDRSVTLSTMQGPKVGWHNQSRVAVLADLAHTAGGWTGRLPLD